MVIKTKLSTITAAIATIAIMATMGIIVSAGAGQQTALALELDLERLLDDEKDQDDDTEDDATSLFNSLLNCKRSFIPSRCLLR